MGKYVSRNASAAPFLTAALLCVCVFPVLFFSEDFPDALCDVGLLGALL